MKKRKISFLLAVCLLISLVAPGTSSMASISDKADNRGKEKQISVEKEINDKNSNEWSSIKSTKDSEMKKEKQHAKKMLAKTKKTATDVVKGTMSSLQKEDGSFISVADGSEISIATAQELRLFSEYTNVGNNTYGVSFIQTQDIDCSVVTMAAIGSGEKRYDYGDDGYDTESIPFCGTYDGQNHFLENVQIVSKMSYTQGIFYEIMDAVVQNVTIKSVRFMQTDAEEETVPMSAWSLGILVGYAYSSTIKNCINEASLDYSAESVSGIVSYMSSGEISDCVNKGNITGDAASDTVVGIVHNGYADINHCANYGNLAAKSFCGGIAYYSTNNMIESCVNEGSIKANMAAGLVCRLGEDNTCYASVNRGDIEGSDYAGGIVAASGTLMIANVMNRGKVTSANYAGGIVGNASGTTILNAISDGDISGAVAAGGIVGTASDAYDYDDYEDYETEYSCEIMNCASLGEVSSDKSKGAIIGSSTIAMNMSYLYQGTKSALPMSGSDTTISGSTLSGDTITADLIATLEENVTAIGDPRLCKWSLDEKGNISCSLRVLIKQNFWSDSLASDTAKNTAYKLYLQDTKGEYTALTFKNAYYGTDVVAGQEYTLYQLMDDGSYKSMDISFVTRESVLLYQSSFSLHLFQSVTSVTGTFDENNEFHITDYVIYNTQDYQDVSEVKLPTDPVREGYTFGGWYSIPYVTSPEYLAQYQANLPGEIDRYIQELEEWYNEEPDWYDEEYGGLSGYIKTRLTGAYGYATKEEILANFETILDTQYKITPENLISDDEDEWSYLRSDTVYARWNKIVPPTQNTSGSNVKDTIINYQNPDPAKYAEKEGKYIKKANVIYYLNTKKKTATVIGVASKSIKRITIQGSIKKGKKSYKVTTIKAKAFAGCQNLKKITVKGNNLKKISKKAFAGKKHKMSIQASKGIKRQLKKACS